MGIIKSLALQVPQIRDIWKQRGQAQAERRELEVRLQDAVALNAQLQVELEHLREAGNAMKSAKLVDFCGRQLVIHGRAGDAYFDAIGDHRTNDFFKFAVSTLKPDAVCLDIGANIGLTASALACNVGEVHSFEPSPPTFLYLLQTLSANRATNVKARQVAVGKEPGELSFFDDANSASASHLVIGDTLGRETNIKVPVTTIDAYARDEGLERIDFIKIDIEGFEIDALHGGERTIREARPLTFVEFNSFTMIGFRNINPREFLDYFRDLFPFVYKWSGTAPIQIASDSDALTFLHDHLVGAGAVDDLLGSFSPLDC